MNLEYSENEIYQLISDGEKKIDGNSFKEVILFVGITGSGKTTLTQFLAGDNDKLFSVAADEETADETGEFFIVDNDKIGNSTITSKTLYPEVILDTDTHEVLVDCPGFSDTRSTNYDIAATIFTKYLIDNVDAVKVVLVVNYNSVRKGVDRIEFASLLDHFNEFLSNVPKYGKSIAMVVTKVENQYYKSRGGMQITSDQVVLKQIAKFLEEIRRELSKEPAIEMLSNKISLIDQLLAKNDEGEFTRIGLFRRPDEAGVLSEIKLLQDEKDDIKNILYNELQYTDITTADFGLTLSDKSRLAIVTMSQQANSKIFDRMEDICKQAIQHYDVVIGASRDYYDLHSVLKDAFHQFKSKLMNNSSLTNVQDYLNVFIKLSNELNVIVSEGTLQSIFDEIKFLNFMKTVSTTADQNTVEKIQMPFTKIIQHLQNMTKWYSYMIASFDKLSQYDVQRNPNSSRHSLLVSKISNEGSELDYYDETSLKHLLALTLNENVQWTCVGDDKLMVFGVLVKLSDAINHFKKCGHDVSTIYIFALNTVFIDVNLNMKEEKKKFVIISPKWDVQGFRELKFDGASRSFEYGQPGGAAGTFFGIGDKFVNDERLVISANGGDGGLGKPGEDGHNGRNGWDAVVPESSPMHSPRTSHEYSCKKLVFASSFYGSRRLEHAETRIPVIYSEDTEVYITYGQQAAAGTNGEHGTKGGKGGMNGKLVLHSLSKPANIFTENLKGSSGSSGKGGKGGKGGRHGSNKTFMCRHFTAAMLFWKVTMEPMYTTSDGYAENGVNGRDGFYEVVSQEDEVELKEYASIVTAYKTIIFKTPANPWSRHETISFLKMLSFKKTILDFYRLQDFVNEFEIMNETYKKSTDNPDWQKYYQLLLESVTSWSHTTATGVDNGILNKLKSKIQDKLMDIKENIFLAKNPVTTETTITLFVETTTQEQQSFTEVDSATLVYVTEPDLSTEDYTTVTTNTEEVSTDSIYKSEEKKIIVDYFVIDNSIDSDFTTVPNTVYDDWDWENKMLSYQKRKKRYLQPVPDNVHNSYRSSATKPTSFIGNTFNWIQTKTKNLFMAEKPIIDTDVVQLPHHNIEPTHEQTFKGSGSVRDGLHFGAANFNPTILLLDLLVRKFTKAKTNHSATCDAHAGLEAQAIALTLTEECEQMLTSQGRDENFDIFELQKQILAKVLQDGPGKVSEIRNAALEFVKSYKL